MMLCDPKTQYGRFDEDESSELCFPCGGCNCIQGEQSYNSTHLTPRPYMEVSDMLHAQAALLLQALPSVSVE